MVHASGKVLVKAVATPEALARVLAKHLPAAAAGEAPAPAQGSVWDPPARPDKAGAHRALPNRAEPAVYWPRMPCLRCGCPWWIGEDWDAKCGRCGWDCETDGYDDDSQPVKTGNWRAKFEEFTAHLKQGKTAPWPPRNSVGKAARR